MAFDPDAYLATKQGFDPDTYLAARKPADEKPPAPPWSEVPLEAVKHIPSNLYDIGAGLIKGAANVAGTVAPYAQYGIAAPGAMAVDAAKAIYNDPTKIPRAVWSDLVEKYGSEENLRRTLAYRPAEVALDAASVIAPVEGVVGKVGEIGRAADVSKPFYEGLPTKPPPSSPPPIPLVLSPVQEALERRRQAGQQVDIPRAVTTESPTIRAASQALSVAPIFGTPLREAVHAVPAQVGGHIEDIAEQFSPKLPENIVGGGIERALSGAAEEEGAARQATAEASDAAAQQKFESEQQAREQAITDRQAQATNAAERTFGDVAPMEMAQDTINDVQSAHRQARTRKDQLYSDVNDLDARVDTSAFTDLRQRAEQALSDAGVSIDDPGSNASKMLRELDRLSGQPGELPANVPPRLMQALQKEFGENVPASVLEQAGFPGGADAVPPDFRMLGRHAPPPGADAVSVQGLEHLNKRIGRMGMDAETAEDRNASRIVKNAFDDWRNDALGNHLTADSAPGARPVIDAARAAHRDLMDRFGYNFRRLPEGEPRNAAKMLNQIVTGGLGPEGLRDNLIGAKPGNRRISAPLFEAIGNAVPNAGEFRNRVRGAYWNTISGGSPKSIASDVAGLTPTRMGSHLFEPHEHDLMRGFADLAQRTPQDLAEVRSAKPPKPTKVEPGKAEQLAGRMLGRNRSDEKVFGKFDSAIREGGDIKEAARVWGKLSDGERNEVRGSWLRNMGGGGADFNVSAFLKNWNDYSKQAKAFMLDREHRAALDDFHVSLKQYADTISKYGNPSGTAQVQAWHKLAAFGLKGAAGLAAAPVALAHLPLTIGSVIGGLGLRKLAKVLAKPQAASDLSRWNRVARSYRSSPSAGKLTALSTLTRTLNAAGE